MTSFAKGNSPLVDMMTRDTQSRPCVLMNAEGRISEVLHGATALTLMNRSKLGDRHTNEKRKGKGES